MQIQKFFLVIFLKTCSYIIGILLILTAFIYSFSPFTTILFLIGGLINLPIVFFTLKKYLGDKTNFQLKRFYTISLVIAVFFTGIGILTNNPIYKANMQKLAEAKQDTKINKPEVTEPIVDISNLLLTDINKIISEFPNGKLTKNTDIKTSNYMYVSPQYSLVFEYQSNETIKNNEAEIDGYNNSLQYLYNFPEKITHVQATLENETCEYHKNIDIKPKAKDFLKKVGFVEPKLIDEFQSPLNKKEVSYEFAEKNATLIIFCSTNLENKPVVRINYSVKLP